MKKKRNERFEKLMSKVNWVHFNDCHNIFKPLTIDLNSCAQSHIVTLTHTHTNEIEWILKEKISAKSNCFMT